MKTFSIQVAFKEGWKLFKANKKALIASTFVLMVAGAFQKAPHEALWKEGLSSALILIAVWVVNVILQIGWIKMLLKLIDEEVTSVKELIEHSGLFWKYAATYILLALLVAVGLVLLIIPGVYWALKYGFAPIIIVDEHMAIRDAFKKSGEITLGVKWKLFWLLIVMVLSNILGALVLFVGLFVSVPVSMLAYLSVYRQLINKASPHLEA